MPHDHLRVLAHPLRMRILSLLTGAAMSAAEAARELGETQANISYHFRRLHEADLLEVAEEVTIRGGRAKRYRHNPDSGRRLTTRDPAEEQLLTKAIAAELLRRAALRAPGRRASLTDAELWVAPEVWERVLAQASGLSRELHAAAQPPRSPGTVRVSASVALFELTDSEPPPPPAAADAPAADTRSAHPPPTEPAAADPTAAGPAPSGSVAAAPTSAAPARAAPTPASPPRAAPPASPAPTDPAVTSAAAAGPAAAPDEAP